MPTSATLERLLPWLVRLSWVGVLVFGEPAIDAATGDRSAAVRAVARSGAGGLWLLGVAAMAIPAVVSLTASRTIVPMVVPVSVAAWWAGAAASDAVPFVAVGVVATVLVFSGEVGRTFVQASAYGDEDRHLLRAPLGYVVVSALAWAITAGGLLVGSLALAAESWALGAPVTAAAVTLAIWSWPRWHRLSRRWLVIVPVGLVVHDHLVMAETIMLRRHEIDAVRLAPADTEAFDLTGPAVGPALEIVTTEAVTVILARRPSEPHGKVIHLTACLVSPSRPGRALRAAAGRRLPVG